MQKTNNKHNSNKNHKTIGYFIPIIFIISIIPLIVRGKVLELPLEVANFWRGGTTHFDFFNYYKSIAFIIGTLAALLSFGGLYLDKRLYIKNEKRYYIPMLVYLIFSVISAIASINKQVAIEGFIEMNQGIFVLLSYMLIAFIIINIVNNEYDIKVIIYSFVALMMIEGFIGLSQYFGHDFFQTSLGQWLITPEQLKGSELKFTFGAYTIYGTMYNTNYVGSFAALAVPISIALYLYSQNRRSIIICAIVTILMIAVWIGSNSRAGYLGILLSSIIGILIFRKVIKREFKKIFVPLLISLLLLVVFNSVSSGRIFTQFKRLWPTIESENLNNIQEQQKIKFKDISINENTFTIITNKETLVGILNDGRLSFTDGNNKLGLKINDQGIIKLLDEKYKDYKFEISNGKIKANIYERRLNLAITKDEQIKIISFNGKLTLPVKAEKLKLFDGKETFASSRGYIWSRTIPMLKNTVLIGYGPDHFPMVFPQEDYVGRFNVDTTGMANTIIDKPHNMYLQTAINTGVISLIALLIMFLTYILDSIKIYINGNLSSFSDFIGASIFLSITAYLVVGIFNDNVISVAPLFWVLFGLGIAINRIVKLSK